MHGAPTSAVLRASGHGPARAELGQAAAHFERAHLDATTRRTFSIKFIDLQKLEISPGEWLNFVSLTVHRKE